MPGTRTPALTTRQQAFVAQLLGRCERVGLPLHQWAEAALADRGVRAIRLIQGVLGLTSGGPPSENRNGTKTWGAGGSRTPTFSESDTTPITVKRGSATSVAAGRRISRPSAEKQRAECEEGALDEHLSI